jgi:hypothetical protein
MNNLSFWLEKKDYSIDQAAMLIAEVIPSQKETDSLENQIEEKGRFAVFEIIRDMLCDAVLDFEISAKNQNGFLVTCEKCGHSCEEINPERTIIAKEDLILWIYEKGLTPEFFKADLKQANIERLIEKNKIKNRSLDECYDKWITEFPEIIGQIETLRRNTTRGEDDPEIRLKQALEYYEENKPLFYHIDKSHISKQWFDIAHGTRVARDVVLESAAHKNGISAYL